MVIDRDKCIACEKCIEYCPVNAIKTVDETVIIDQELCTECEVCFRSRVCPVDAIVRVHCIWPRTIRNIFSDVMSVSKETGITGRGTDESKTNDVTNKYKKGEVGFAVDVGRPSIGGVRLREVEKICLGLSKLSPEYDLQNPLVHLMEDKEKGKFKEDVLDENVISAIIEFKTPLEKCVEVVRTLEEISQSINTVFSLGVISRVDEDGTIKAAKLMREAGIPIRPNGKTTLNLGRV